MKRIILCADDYGQNPAISQAIVELLRKNRISATSCMVTRMDWNSQASWLEPFKEQADIGLHFNLTEGPLLTDIGVTPLKLLIKKAFLREIDKDKVKKELTSQINKFIEVTGYLPAFLDGHQHIHQLPQIRDVVIQVYDEKLRPNNSFIRSTYNADSFYQLNQVDYLKQLIIQLCGGYRFKQELLKNNIPHNINFAGIYNFKNAAHYSQYFPRFLKQIKKNGMIMCHPGLMSSEKETIANARHYEYSYFSSQQFTTLCSDQNISIVRFRDLK